MPRKAKLIGKKFDRLLVLSEVEKRDRNGRVNWLCKCDCGNITKAVTNQLTKGKTRSCGCLQREIAKNTMTKHGLKNHPLYTRWINMKQRCYNTNKPEYKNYGGRGIKVCDRWLDNFESYYNDLMSGYSENLQVDRVDNDGDYTPENCRWVTPQQNRCNRGSDLDSSSKYKGVSKISSTGRWQVQLKDVYIGCFSTQDLAAIAYNSAAKELFGEYAYLNKVK